MRRFGLKTNQTQRTRRSWNSQNHKNGLREVPEMVLNGLIKTERADALEYLDGN